MAPYSPITPAIRAELEARLSPGALITDPSLLTEYAGDASHMTYPPEPVVRAGLDDVIHRDAVALSGRVL